MRLSLEVYEDSLCTQTVERMKAELEQDQREIKVEGTELDLASFRSTRECADAFKAKNLPLHLLINNAGVAFIQQLSERAYFMHVVHSCETTSFSVHSHDF